jgi:hypothetical protein
LSCASKRERSKEKGRRYWRPDDPSRECSGGGAQGHYRQPPRKKRPPQEKTPQPLGGSHGAKYRRRPAEGSGMGVPRASRATNSLVRGKFHREQKKCPTVWGKPWGGVIMRLTGAGGSSMRVNCVAPVAKTTKQRRCCSAAPKRKPTALTSKENRGPPRVTGVRSEDLERPRQSDTETRGDGASSAQKTPPLWGGRGMSSDSAGWKRPRSDDSGALGKSKARAATCDRATTSRTGRPTWQ